MPEEFFIDGIFCLDNWFQSWKDAHEVAYHVISGFRRDSRNTESFSVSQQRKIVLYLDDVSRPAVGLILR
jgi:hypothetical protein